jgi:hypothetical protein
VKAHWTDRTDPLFVEVAEAIGTTTDLVMAASPRGEYVVAMATPDLDEHSRDFVKCILKRDADGILREIKREVEVGGLDELEAFIKRGLGT